MLMGLGTDRRSAFPKKILSRSQLVERLLQANDASRNKTCKILLPPHWYVLRSDLKDTMVIIFVK